jgi:hypothetical protein
VLTQAVRKQRIRSPTPLLNAMRAMARLLDLDLKALE